jgi:hypothetical protein
VTGHITNASASVALLAFAQGQWRGLAHIRIVSLYYIVRIALFVKKYTMVKNYTKVKKYRE